MNAPLLAALDRAVLGDPQALQGLGIEQAIVSSPDRADRLSTDGAGMVTLTSTRAPADRGGAPIGIFRSTLASDELTALITAVRAVVSKPPEPARGAGVGHPPVQTVERRVAEPRRDDVRDLAEPAGEGAHRHRTVLEGAHHFRGGLLGRQPAH